ncbi:hypothetical protein ABLG96_08815 [Nakamurella sp. A5-74]|uniref:Uncharacterized protein n=1 Tax=Nakamurella sp. A5-74 TaxID=3158264 RepID=A0AAU8DU49_9ACTN
MNRAPWWRRPIPLPRWAYILLASASAAMVAVSPALFPGTGGWVIAGVFMVLVIASIAGMANDAHGERQRRNRF